MCRLNSKVLEHNNKIILEVRNPTALIESVNNENSTSTNDDKFNSLCFSFHSPREAKYMLTINELTVGLSNGLVGLVKEMTRNNNRVLPSLTHLVFVDF